MIRRIRSQFLPPDATLFVALATVWGLSFVAIEAGLAYVPPLYFAGVRYALAGVLVLAYAALTTDRVRPQGRTEWLNVAVVGVFLVGGYHAFLYVGQLSVPGPVAAVVVSLSPILTAALAATLLGDDLDWIAGVGFALGLVGVAIVADFEPANFLGSDLVGIAVLFVAAGIFALGSVLSTPLRTTLADVSMQGWAMLLGAAALFAGSFARGEAIATTEWSPTALAALVYLTLVSGVIGFLVYFALHERIGPTESNMVSYFQPIVAALGAWLLFGQTVSATTVIGFLGIFASFLLVKHDVVRARVDVTRARAAPRNAIVAFSCPVIERGRGLTFERDVAYEDLYTTSTSGYGFEAD
ncbi:DMT family transporter [Halobellus captivus]|uniref:DMT family transporter n=1 Tax=Halobellus captivus TaxID=2592614 RepID=UPI00119DB288|nr:EamA family transporter [Halobellus captivus]